MSATRFAPRPAVRAPRPWSFPAPRTWVLDNGLRVECYELPGRRLAAARVVLDLPLSAEPMPLEGVATVMVRTLDEGTEARDADAFAAALERHGASYQAYAGHAGSYVELDVAAGRLAPALALMAEAVMSPAFPVGEVDRHVRLRLDEITRERAVAASRASIELSGRCFAEESRPARPSGGTSATVARLDRDAVADFYERRVGPARTTLVLAGDFAGVDVDAAVAAAFGQWRDRVVDGAEVQEPTAASPSVVVVDRPDAVQSQVALGMPGPDRRSPLWADLTVAAYALGGGMSSRLMTHLRETKGYTYGVRARFGALRRGGLFRIDTAVQTDVTGATVADTLDVVATMAAEGLRPDERDAAVDFHVGVDPLAYQTAGAVADAASDAVGNDLPERYLDHFRGALRAVTAESASAAFAGQVEPKGLSLVIVGDAASVVDQLRERGFPQPAVVPA